MTPLSPSRCESSCGGTPSKTHSRVARAAEARLQIRDARACLFEDLFGLRCVALGDSAHAEPVIRECVRIGLDLQILSREEQTLLKRAILDVVGSDVREQHHEHVVVVSDRRLQRRVGHLNAATESAPEIQFPSQIESDLRLAEPLFASGDGGFIACLVPRVTTGQFLGLREEVADGDPAY